MIDWAVPGRQVVCIDDYFECGYDDGRIRRRGVYTIVKLIPVAHRTTLVGRYARSSLIITLAECINPFDHVSHGYAIERFKPVISQSDDIALIKSLIEPGLADSLQRLDALREKMDSER